MNVALESFRKILVFAAHPDDESIACGGLLQRAAKSLVVFAVDGAPPHYGFAEKFGSLQQYSEERFREAGRALRFVPQASFRRLAQQNGTWFVDQHLFQNLPEAFTCLHKTVREFSPDLLVSHAFEGGHIDHDACHVLASKVAATLSVPILEFPLYWRDDNRHDVFQKFRNNDDGEVTLELSEQETAIKKRMLSEYQTQRGLTSVFRLETERFRPMKTPDCTKLTWSGYPFENRWRQLKAAQFVRKITDLHQCAAATHANSQPSNATDCL